MMYNTKKGTKEFRFFFWRRQRAEQHSKPVTQVTLRAVAPAVVEIRITGSSAAGLMEVRQKTDSLRGDG